MNNAQYFELDIYDLELQEKQAKTKAKLKEEETKLIKTIEAIERVAKNKDWRDLSELLFKDMTTSLERQIMSEALNKDIDKKKIYSLQGQLAWAKRYTDLTSLSDIYIEQLKAIKQQLTK